MSDLLHETGGLKKRVGLRLTECMARVRARVGGEPYDAQTGARHQGERYFPLLLSGGSWVKVVSSGS
jgi:hypothetical protein